MNLKENEVLKEKVQLKLEKTNAEYKVTAEKKRREKLFEEGDMVIVYLRRKTISVGAYNKLKPKIMDCSRS